MHDWDREVDLLVFGSGAGGLATALVGRIIGLDVLLCEKTEFFGGTTALSGGESWIPGNNKGDQGSLSSDLEASAEYLESEARMETGKALRDAYLRNAARAIAFLEENSDLRFTPVSPHPDYHQDSPGASKGGRPVATVPFDGRQLGDTFSLLRPPRPDFLVFGGMMVSRDDIAALLSPVSSPKAFLHCAHIVTRYFVDRLNYPRGTRLVMGNALVARFLLSLKKREANMSTNAAFKELVKDESGVIGALVTINGRVERIRARGGIVLATGGFPANRELRERYFGAFQVNESLGFEGNTGDALNASIRVGGAVDTELNTPAAWMPASKMVWPDGRVSVFPHIRDRAKPGLIAVNASGNRFVDESASYHDVSLAMFREQNGDPDVPAYLICDHSFIGKYGIGLIKPRFEKLKTYEACGYLKTGDTLEDLAKVIGVSANNLVAAVKSQNEAATVGQDMAFGKGSSFYGRHYGDPDHKPNPCLGPILTPPFHAVAIHPAPIATYVGLATDEYANVLDTDRRPIPGLYACGNDMAAIARGSYPGPGSTIGPAMTFGYIAATRIHEKMRLSSASKPDISGVLGA